MNPFLLVAMVGALIVGTGSAFHAIEAASTRQPSVRLENGLLINSRAGYYSSVPEGWRLDDASTYELAKVVHPESGAEFSVYYLIASGTPTMNYMTMMSLLQQPEMEWRTLG